MAYKTIMVHVDHSKHTAARIQVAAAIAQREDAHLIGAATSGVSRFIYGDGMTPPVDPILLPYLDILRDRAFTDLKNFAAVAQNLGVANFEKRMIDDDPLGGITLHGRFSDLIVIGQNDPYNVAMNAVADFPEYIVMNSGRPVLIIPHSWTPANVGKEVLVAWDASLESSRAITNAIPILKRADNVKVVTFNPGKLAAIEQVLPGNDIALFLARHGIKVEVMRKETGNDIGDALLSLASETQSDLIVMGAYGHSRLREIMLGGATRAVLESMTVPVLMSH